MRLICGGVRLHGATVDAVPLDGQHVGHDSLLVFRRSNAGANAYIPWSSQRPIGTPTSRAKKNQMLAAVECSAGHTTFLQSDRDTSENLNGLGDVINDGSGDAGLTN